MDLFSNFKRLLTFSNMFENFFSFLFSLKFILNRWFRCSKKVLVRYLLFARKFFWFIVWIYYIILRLILLFEHIFVHINCQILFSVRNFLMTFKLMIHFFKLNSCHESFMVSCSSFLLMKWFKIIFLTGYMISGRSFDVKIPPIPFHLSFGSLFFVSCIRPRPSQNTLASL